MASFFHTPKPKLYHIEPRYWDPEKEKKEARERRIKAELGMQENGTDFQSRIKGEFRKGLSKGSWSASSQRRKSNTRIVAIAAILIVLFWILMK